MFFPKSFDMEAKGELQPKARKHVFVRVDGTIDELYVKHGDVVERGAPLAKLTNPDLAVQYAQYSRERETAIKQYNSNKQLAPQIENEVDRNQLYADMMELRVNIESYDAQLKLIEEQQRHLIVRSPIAGEIVTWDVDRILLNRPVQTGTAILTVADPNSEWEIVADMEEDRMGHVARAFVDDNTNEREVSYILKSDPGTKLKGVLSRDAIHDASQLNDEQLQTVRMFVDINEEQLENPRPGTEVTVKVHCGQRSVGYVWFHELIEFMQSTIFF
jgi:multidrug resistance efflux pump